MKISSLILCLLWWVDASGALFFTPEMISTHIKGYNEEELVLIKKDLGVVRSVCLEGTHNTEKKFYLATAGAPGALKTTILEKFIATHPEYAGGVYLDPDPRTLKFMVHTYYARSLSALAIASAASYDEAIRNAYEKWRGASNYIVLTLLEEAFDAGRSIFYGTTSTGGHMATFCSKLKENGYEVIFLMCSCSDALRYESVDYRNKVVRFYQSTPEDTIVKGVLFPQRMPVYFEYADKLYFYWNDSHFGGERLAGIWQKGKLEIHDADAMTFFIEKYEEDRKTLAEKGTTIPSFDSYLK